MWAHFNANPGAITAVATVVLVIVTFAYVLLTRRLVTHTRMQVAEMRRQCDQLVAHDAKTVRRAVQAIVAEAEVNAELLDGTIGRPLLVGAYPINLWALCETPSSQSTLLAVARAHAFAEDYNGRHAGDVSGRTRTGDTELAWEAAKKVVKAAIEALQKDEELQRFLREGSETAVAGDR